MTAEHELEPVPTTPAEALRLCADWFDVLDEAFALIASLNGKVRAPEGQDTCQKALRALADWFDERPLPSKLAWDAMSAAADFTADTTLEPSLLLTDENRTMAQAIIDSALKDAPEKRALRVAYFRQYAQGMRSDLMRAARAAAFYDYIAERVEEAS